MKWRRSYLANVTELTNFTIVARSLPYFVRFDHIVQWTVQGILLLSNRLVSIAMVINLEVLPVEAHYFIIGPALEMILYKNEKAIYESKFVDKMK
jgi:hypothetical protein